MSGRRSPAWTVRLGLPFLIAVLTAACFLPALENGFVDFDDDLNLTRNPRFRGLSPGHLRWMLHAMVGGHWQPLTWLSFALDHAIWGMDPRGYHLTSLLLHALNGAVAYLVFTALLERALLPAPAASAAPRTAPSPTTLRLAAAWAALCWALHPLRVESVAWATERRDVLSGLFFLLAVLTYLYAHPAAGRRAGRWLLVSVSLAGVSLLAKAWAITLPALLLVVDAYPLRRRFARAAWRTLVVEKVPYVLLAVAAAEMARRAQSATFASLDDHPLPSRLVQAAVGLASYVWKSVLPIGLQPLYELERPFPVAAPHHLGAVLAVIGVTVVAVACRRRWPAALAAWCACIIVASPVLGITQAGPQLTADRYTYLATLPLAALLAGGAYRLAIAAPRPWASAGLAVAGVALLGVLAAGTQRQIRVWHDTLTLWQHAVAVDPDNASVRYRLVTALLQARRGDEAVQQVAALAAIAAARPDDRTARTQLAYAHGRLALSLAAAGHTEQAIALLEQARALLPRDALVLANLAYVQFQAGRLDDAVASWQAALAAQPGSLEARSGLGAAFLRLGRLDEAETALRAALDQSPDDPDVLTNLGAVRWRQGRRAEAIALWERALALDPEHALARRSRDDARRAMP